MATAVNSRDPENRGSSGASSVAERSFMPRVQVRRDGRRTRFLDAPPKLVEHWDLVDPQIAAILRAMRADLSDGSPAGRRFGESLANALALYFVSRYGARSAPKKTPRGGLPARRLRKVLDYIGENLAGDLCVQELAHVAGMSAHYFSELFRKSVGRSPHQYVLSRRIERAKETLRNPKRSVLEAGLSAGFQNPSHFARAFRRVMGTSPRRFRANC